VNAALLLRAAGRSRQPPVPIFSRMADFMNMLRQAQELQKNLERAQEELEKMTISGASGGGMVTAEVNGKGQVRRVKIDPGVVNSSDVEMLEDLIVVAVVDAQKKAQEAAQEQIGKLGGGLNLPFKLPF
jgi:DNA-binding YbaB/EbfC family protein